MIEYQLSITCKKGGDIEALLSACEKQGSLKLLEPTFEAIKKASTAYAEERVGWVLESENGSIEGELLQGGHAIERFEISSIDDIWESKVNAPVSLGTSQPME